METQINFMVFIIWILQCRLKRNLAKENEKDIVLFNSKVTPAICKLLDYKKFLMDRFKNEILQKEKKIQTQLEKKTQTKNISLQLKDKININDLKTKVNQLKKQLMKKNVGNLALSIQTNKENIEDAKGILMNFEKLIQEYLFPVGKIKEQFVGKDGEKFDLKEKEEKDDLDDITNNEEYINEGRIYLNQNFELRQEIFEETEENIQEIIDKKIKIKPEEIQEKETLKVVDELFSKYKKKDEKKSTRKVKKTKVFIDIRNKKTYDVSEIQDMMDSSNIAETKEEVDGNEIENFLKTVEKYDLKKKYYVDLNEVLQNCNVVNREEKKEEEFFEDESTIEKIGKKRKNTFREKKHQKMMDLIEDDNTEFKDIEVKNITKNFDKNHPLHDDMILYFKKKQIPTTDENIRNFLYTTLQKNMKEINNNFFN